MRTRDDRTRRAALFCHRQKNYRYRSRLGDAFVDYSDALPSDRSSPSRVKAILGALHQRRLERLYAAGSDSNAASSDFAAIPARLNRFSAADSPPASIRSAPPLRTSSFAAAAAAAAAARARASNAAGPPRVVRATSKFGRLATASANGHPGSGLLGFESRRREPPDGVRLGVVFVP